MATKAHFENIKEKIIEQLSSSTKSLKVAVAWFTDADLFEILCLKAKSGLRVELLIANDQINHNCNIDYNKLTSCGGKIYFVGEGTEYEPIMHHKFCIIDNYTLIFGSYNWTNKAKSNHENITIIDNDANIILDYNDEFERLRYYQSTEKKIQFESKVVKLPSKSNDELYEDNWTFCNENSNNLRIIKKGGKIGLFDMKTRNEILDCQFDKIDLIKGNYAIVQGENIQFLFDFFNKKKIELLSSEFKANAKMEYGHYIDVKWESTLVFFRDIYLYSSDDDEDSKHIGRVFITECTIQRSPNVSSDSYLIECVIEKNGRFYSSSILSQDDLDGENKRNFWGYVDYVTGSGEYEVMDKCNDDDNEIHIYNESTGNGQSFNRRGEEKYITCYCKAATKLYINRKYEGGKPLYGTMGGTGSSSRLGGTGSNRLNNPFFEI